MEKWLHYFEIYDRHLGRLRGQPIHFLEIGVKGGGSLQMWQAYFGPMATIHGVDVDPAARCLEAEGFRIHVGDQSDPAFLDRLKADVPVLDVVLDDGGHRMHQMWNSFAALFPHLATNGLYVVEDLHACYMPEYGGGYKSTASFAERSKDWVDLLHLQYVVGGAAREPGVARGVASMHYYDSVLVLEKGLRGPGMILQVAEAGVTVQPARPVGD